MKYLFVHQNFPGQFLHLVRHLVDQGDNEVVFVSQPNQNHIPGVRKVVYQVPSPPVPGIHVDAQEFETAIRRAEAVARTCETVRQLNYKPDVVIGHHGWGELLNIADVWPGVPLLGYYEFYYHTHGVDVDFDPEFPTDRSLHPRIRAKNTVNLLALTNGGWGFCPTIWQHSTYPDWARRRITLVPEGVNLDSNRPDPAIREETQDFGGFAVGPNERLLTYVARDLEPYRGFHTIMRALPRLLEERPDLKVVLVGGDGVSYGARLSHGSWKDYMLREVGVRMDPARVHFAGRVAYDVYQRLLKRSDVHVYLTYPFVASWSLREALATGCAIVASDTQPVHEFIVDGQTGLLTPCLDPKLLAERVLEVLEDAALNRRLRAGARSWAEKHLQMEDYLTAFDQLVADTVAR